jgi:exopolysaccharide biosynthesis polyprenyl glycosylphosphotransferase
VQDVTDGAADAGPRAAAGATGGGPRVPAPTRGSTLTATLAALAATEADTQAVVERFGMPGTGALLARRDRAKPNDARRVRPRWRNRYTRLLVLCDTAAAVAAMELAARLATPRIDPLLAALAAAAVVGAVTLNRSYEHRYLGHGTDELHRVWTACVYLVAATSLAAYATQTLQVRPLVVVGIPLAAVGLLGVHGVARLLLYRMRRRGRCVQKVVAIGSERSVAEMVRTTRSDPNAGLEIVGACVTRSIGSRIEDVPVLGTPADALGALRAVRADTVILTAWSDVAQDDLRRLSWDLEGSGAQLLVAPRLAEVSAPRMHIRTVRGQPLLNVEEPEFTGIRRLVKKALDWTLTLPGLLVLSPVLLCVALAVKLTSPGPVLFRQERVGKHTQPFRMTKFRSMYVDAEQRLAQLQHLNEHGGGPLFKMKDDPRVTPVGRFIRRFSLDELPQLFDVLRGDMSLVGPRPPLPREVQMYEEDVRRRLVVKPGITGLWQVSGRSDLSWDESVRLDLQYVDDWTLWLDLKIIAQTLAAVLARKGAY